MPTTDLIAVLISDLHLSLIMPACRADKDWLAVQAGYLEQVKDLADGLPVLCAGDIFDRWNPPPELINFALRHLPDGMICVPGQHDLPSHRIEDSHRSGYGVLWQADKIRDIAQPAIRIWPTKQFIIYGFGWNQEIEPPTISDNRLAIALIHRYFWADGKSYPGAPTTAHIHAFKKQLKGYDVAVSGDNHLSFIAQCGDCTVANMGGFIRRKSDEINRQPSVGLLYSDGTVKRHKLDTSGDLFHEGAEERPEMPIDLVAFISSLEKLGEHGMDFREAVKNHLRTADLDEGTKEIIRRSLEHQI